MRVGGGGQPASVRAPNRSNKAICGPSKTTFCDCDCDLCDCTVAMDRTLFANIINCMGLFPHKHIISPLVHKYVTLNLRNPRLAESIYGSDARQIEEGSNFGMYAFWIRTIYGQTCVHACVCFWARGKFANKHTHAPELPTIHTLQHTGSWMLLRAHLAFACIRGNARRAPAPIKLFGITPAASSSISSGSRVEKTRSRVRVLTFEPDYYWRMKVSARALGAMCVVVRCVCVHNGCACVCEYVGNGIKMLCATGRPARRRRPAMMKTTNAGNIVAAVRADFRRRAALRNFGKEINPRGWESCIWRTCSDMVWRGGFQMRRRFCGTGVFFV